MKLDKTKALIHSEIKTDNPVGSLIEILECVVELLSLPDCDVCWSSWKDPQEAINEVESIIRLLKSSEIPAKLDVSVLFAPTGPLQEVSLSSGWGDAFLKMAEKFDQVEHLIWR